MMKHRYSRSPVTFNNSTISGDDTIVSGNFTSASAPDILDLSEVDVNFNSGAVKTSTKRGNMEEDLKNVWDLLSLAYKKQKEKERSYLKHDSKSRRSSLDDTLEIEKQDEDNNTYEEIFNMDKTLLSLSSRKSDRQRSDNNPAPEWNAGEMSSNAIAEPWVIKYKYDDDGFKIYEDVELNDTATRTLEGSFSSVSSSESLDRTKPVTRKRSLKRSLTKLFSRPMKIRRN